MPKSLKSNVSFDDALPLLGGYGRFQYILGLVWVSFFGTAGWQYYITTILVGQMDHWCHIPELSHMNVSTQKHIAIPTETNKFGRQVYSNCRMFALNYSSIPLGGDFYERQANISTAKCSSWNYDTSVFHSSLTNQYDLVCDDKWMFTLAGTCFMGGIWLGALVSGPLADRFGRKFMTTILVTLLAIFILVSALMTSYPAFLVCRFIVGANLTGAYQTLWTYNLEASPKKNRSRGFFFSMFGRLLKGVFVLAAFLLRNHVHFQICSAAVVIIPFVCIILLPESPRWLLVRGRIDEAEKVCRLIAKINGVTLKDSFSLKTINDESKKELLDTKIDHNEENGLEVETKSDTTLQTTQTTPTLLDLFRTPRLRKHTIITYFAWSALVFSAFGLMVNTDQLIPGNLYLNLLVMFAGSEVAGIVLAYFSFFKMPRRIAVSSFLIATGICILAMVPLLLTGINGIITALAFGGGVFTTNLWPLMYGYTGEIFPTEARAIGIGSGSSFGRIWGMISPQVTLLDEYWYGLPYLLLGGVPAVIGFLVLLLPETKDKRLPETLEEAELFGTASYDDIHGGEESKKSLATLEMNEKTT